MKQKIKSLRLDNLKEHYQILSWLFVKNDRKVPKYINDILDLIEVLEDRNNYAKELLNLIDEFEDKIKKNETKK
jgi:hypothetical protein